MQSQSGFFRGPSEDFTNMFSSLEPVHTSGSGFTLLYRSRQGGRNRLYKCLKDDFREDPLYENLLRKEFEIGYMLSHPGICEYYAFTEIPQLGHCIEMEWIDGKTLSERLQEGSLSEKTARKILIELSDALDYMHHKQIIHRDLKPENIMVTSNGDNAKIIDFGFSDSDSHMLLKAPAGTRMFASPELLDGEEIDCRLDIYSLGKIMALMPGKYGKIIEKSTAKDREDRYASAYEIKAALQKTGKKFWILAAVILVMVAALAYAIILLSTRKAEKAVDKMFYETRDMIMDSGLPEPSDQD